MASSSSLELVRLRTRSRVALRFPRKILQYIIQDHVKQKNSRHDLTVDREREQCLFLTKSEHRILVQDVSIYLVTSSWSRRTLCGSDKLAVWAILHDLEECAAIE